MSDADSRPSLRNRKLHDQVLRRCFRHILDTELSLMSCVFVNTTARVYDPVSDRVIDVSWFIHGSTSQERDDKPPPSVAALKGDVAGVVAKHHYPSERVQALFAVVQAILDDENVEDLDPEKLSQYYKTKKRKKERETLARLGRLAGMEGV